MHITEAVARSIITKKTDRSHASRRPYGEYHVFGKYGGYDLTP